MDTLIQYHSTTPCLVMRGRYQKGLTDNRHLFLMFHDAVVSHTSPLIPGESSAGFVHTVLCIAQTELVVFLNRKEEELYIVTSQLSKTACAQTVKRILW